MSLFTITLR
uniref:Uncharacterized protein n=1 Tax=Rhizophora mucronata TaxID=61149 RepID=A0A2P2R4B8_RHIMU